MARGCTRVVSRLATTKICSKRRCVRFWGEEKRFRTSWTRLCENAVCGEPVEKILLFGCRLGAGEFASTLDRARSEKTILFIFEVAGFSHSLDPERTWSGQASNEMSRQSGFAPENLITFAHFAVSSEMRAPNLPGDKASTVTPNSANRSFNFASPRPALISRSRRAPAHVPEAGEADQAGAPAGHDDFYKSYVLFVSLVQRKIMGGARFAAVKPA